MFHPPSVGFTPSSASIAHISLNITWRYLKGSLEAVGGCYGGHMVQKRSMMYVFSILRRVLAHA
ncbi:hypothetical protein BD309DRAFT_967346 [Dichomitus squalens]|nr:hypothetical protein BD309DRAFT_967346 [Dichomitus squalens]